MNNELHDDEILFDRLVDGELSAAERRTLLESLDARPQGWRRCALAFLESQLWQNELRSAAACGLAPTPVQKSPAPIPPTMRTRKMWAAAQWLAVAASLLVAFKFGALQRNPGIPLASIPAKTNEQFVSVPPAAGVAAPNTAKPGDALNLWVRDDAGQMRRVRVPLVDTGALDNELGLQFQTGVPDDVRNRLQNRGYTVQSKRQYAPMWLDNGRPMVVPVEDTKIVPVSNKVY
jgi:hypothetical protein